MITLKKIPLPSSSIFSSKPYSLAFLNDAFRVLPKRPDPFLGVLKAENGQGVLMLILLQGQPYAAGKWTESGFQTLSIHAYFQMLNSLQGASLSLYESDPIYLKCLLVLFQKLPSTQVSTDLVNVEGLLDRLKYQSSESMVVLKKNEDHNFFYFSKNKLQEAYFHDPKMKEGEASLEEALLSLVYSTDKNSPLELFLYSDLAVNGASDAQYAQPEDVMISLVDYFLKPQPYLDLRHPHHETLRIFLDEKEFSIGREDKNDLMLDDPLVSRRHATLYREGEVYFLRDEKSRNGIRLNGKPMDLAKLAEGDEIGVGEYNLRFSTGLSERMERSMPLALPEGSETMLLSSPVGAQSPQYWLEVVEGPMSGKRFELSKNKTVIGRGEADLVILDPKISRHHAVLEWEAEGLCFSDLNSVNGCFINGEKIKHRLISSGDMIRLGGTTLKVAIQS